MRTRTTVAIWIVALQGAVAAADPSVRVEPAVIHPGDPVLVTVANTDKPPHGKAGGQPLEFFRARNGYQAVFAVPLDINEDHMLVEFDAGPKPLSIAVRHKQFGESKLVVEEEYANPNAEDRKLIDADNGAIVRAYEVATDAPRFARAFRRPVGTLTSPFGEWRTFNDGHRAQHLGADFAAPEGAKVAAINDGTVALVRDTFLAGTVVVLAHGGGISSRYFHLSRPTVHEGDMVKQGQEIGRAGHTGRTTGPHLHLGIHAANGVVDPIAFLKLHVAVLR